MAIVRNRAQSCPLDPGRKHEARQLFLSSRRSLKAKDVLSIICLLICEEHQRTYTYRTKIRERWSVEFPHLDLNNVRSPSSLAGKRGRRRASSVPTPSDSDEDMLDRGAIPVTSRSGPISRPNFIPFDSSRPTSRGRQPATPSTDDDERVHHSRQGHSMFSPGLDPESPLASRSRWPVSRTSMGESSANAVALAVPSVEPRNLFQAVENENDSQIRCASAAPTERTQSTEDRDDNAPGPPTLEGRSGLPTIDIVLIDADNPMPTVEDHPMGEEDVNNIERDADNGALSPNNNQSPPPPNDSSSPPPPAVPQGFSLGSASTWSPWSLRCEVLALLWEPLPSPKSKGSIYAVEVDTADHGPMVKIGYTTRDVKVRLREIAREHQQPINLDTPIRRSHIPILQLQRLEKLVHTDLAFFQRNLEVHRGRVHKTHGEYFAVDLKTAENTIDMWRDIIEDLGLEPGTEVDRHIIKNVEGHIAQAMEHAGASATAEPEMWTRLNADHARRENLWKQAFQQGRGGFKKSKSDTTNGWLLKIIVLLGVPVLFGVGGGLIGFSYIVAVVSYGLLNCLRLV